VLERDQPPLLVINHVNVTKMRNQYLLSPKSCSPAEACNLRGCEESILADLLIVYRELTLYYLIILFIAIFLVFTYEARHGNSLRR
jgi:hypothetical protein